MYVPFVQINVPFDIIEQFLAKSKIKQSEKNLYFIIEVTFKQGSLSERLLIET